MMARDRLRSAPAQRLAARLSAGARAFARIARELGARTRTGCARRSRAGSADGALSRIGAVFAARRGRRRDAGRMAVPRERLEAVAALVSAHPGVNHNYEREHRYNLWFVDHRAATRQRSRARAGRRSRRDTGLPALRLPLRARLPDRPRFRPSGAIAHDAPPRAASRRRRAGGRAADRDRWLTLRWKTGCRWCRGPTPHGRSAPAWPRREAYARCALAAANGGVSRASASSCATTSSATTPTRWRCSTCPRPQVDALRRRAGARAGRDAVLPPRARRRLAVQPVLHGARPRPRDASCAGSPSWSRGAGLARLPARRAVLAAALQAARRALFRAPRPRRPAMRSLTRTLLASTRADRRRLLRPPARRLAADDRPFADVGATSSACAKTR